MESLFVAPVRPEIGDMALATINIAFRSDINGVEPDEVRRGSVGWDIENLEIGLSDGWFAG